MNLKLVKTAWQSSGSLISDTNLDCDEGFVAVSRVADLARAARRGEPIILLSGPSGEEIADIICPAGAADASMINMFARDARGLICLAMPESRADTLGIHKIKNTRNLPHTFDFGVSIEAASGVTTGISAEDRACTIAAAANEAASLGAVVTPGHIFPMLARDAGLAARAGRAEAALEIMTIAGLPPMAVICQMLATDGEAIESNELAALARSNGYLVGRLADLADEAALTHSGWLRVKEEPAGTMHEVEWTQITCSNTLDGNIVEVLVCGDWPHQRRVPVWSVKAMEPDTSPIQFRKRWSFDEAMATMAAAGRGAIILGNPSAIQKNKFDARPDVVEMVRLNQAIATSALLSALGISEPVDLADWIDVEPFPSMANPGEFNSLAEACGLRQA